MTTSQELHCTYRSVTNDVRCTLKAGHGSPHFCPDPDPVPVSDDTPTPTTDEIIKRANDSNPLLAPTPAPTADVHPVAWARPISIRPREITATTSESHRTIQVRVDRRDDYFTVPLYTGRAGAAPDLTALRFYPHTGTCDGCSAGPRPLREVDPVSEAWVCRECDETEDAAVAAAGKAAVDAYHAAHEQAALVREDTDHG